MLSARLTKLMNEIDPEVKVKKSYRRKLEEELDDLYEQDFASIKKLRKMKKF